jgi:hypothetical protein
VDSLAVKVTKGGKLVRELPSQASLSTMLRSEVFLGHFRPLDMVTRTPVYLDLRPGYNDGGPGKRILYLGPEPRVAGSADAIDRFLGAMASASGADRTNTVAAALTVLLRLLFPIQKPLSHAGKGTITEFIRGPVAKAAILYESIDWPMQSQFQRQVKADPGIGLALLDNVRLDSAGGRARLIRSAFVESFVTSAQLTLASPGAGEPVRLANHYVVAIDTNDGLLSPDLLNRALSIHLAPTGNIEDRESPLGNPKLEFLPAHREQIQAELRGMVERWKAAGRPLGQGVKHPMALWARSLGGILAVAGYGDFLGNHASRKTAADPGGPGGAGGGQAGQGTPPRGVGQAGRGAGAGQGAPPAHRAGHGEGAGAGHRGPPQPPPGRVLRRGDGGESPARPAGGRVPALGQGREPPCPLRVHRAHRGAAAGG